MEDSNSKPKVIILSGPNGAGKSTLAPLLLRDTFGIMEYVNADTVALGLSAFNAEKAAFEAGRVMLKRLHTLAKQRVTFAFESTLAGRSYAPWINKLRKQGYEFHLFFLWLRDPELAVKRVEERVRLGGHDVPETVIRKRYYQGIRNFHALYSPLAKSWSVYDNSDSGVPLLIAARGEDISPVIYQSDLWAGFCETAKWQ